MLKDAFCWLSRMTRYYWLHGVFVLLAAGSYFRLGFQERGWTNVFRYLFLYYLLSIISQGKAAQRRNDRRDAVADADLQDLKDAAAEQARRQKLIEERQAKIYSELGTRTASNVATLKESLATIQTELKLNRDELADNTELTRKVGETLAKTTKKP